MTTSCSRPGSRSPAGGQGPGPPGPGAFSAPVLPSATATASRTAGAARLRRTGPPGGPPRPSIVSYSAQPHSQARILPRTTAPLIRTGDRPRPGPEQGRRPIQNHDATGAVPATIPRADPLAPADASRRIAFTRRRPCMPAQCAYNARRDRCPKAEGTHRPGHRRYDDGVDHGAIVRNFGAHFGTESSVGAWTAITFSMITAARHVPPLAGRLKGTRRRNGSSRSASRTLARRDLTSVKVSWPRPVAINLQAPEACWRARTL